MRRQSRVLVTWTVLSFFIFSITFNFYVNVWTIQSEQLPYLDSVPDHTAHSKGSYIWVSSHNSHHVVTEHSRNNVTILDHLKGTQQYSEHGEVVTTLMVDVTPEPNVWPSVDNYNDDRILSQLNLMSHIETPGRLKKILLHNGFKDWGVKPGRASFIEQKCPVNTCQLTDNTRDTSSADAVLFRQHIRSNGFKRPPHQTWILFFLESPYVTPSLKRYSNQFNLIASYRRDSDIVAPYEKYVKHPPNGSHIQSPMTRNYAAGKTKKVAWFASNCRASNARMEYVRELSKYIEVDVYGKCGKKSCPRAKSECFAMLDTDYKFYLAFENANCRDYITEKFFVTGLQHDVIPIVMGAAPEDYRRVAPHLSFIHVDEYPGPKGLAEYLNVLDSNDDAYNEYFRWKDKGSFINTYFWCRVCAMLHDTTHPAKTYGNIEEWWRGKDVCIGKDRWAQHPRTNPFISNYYGTSNRHDVIPIVMGAAPEDYRRVAPHLSFIHVDEYPGPKGLAEYLNVLDSNDDAYNEYFRWKDKGSFINTYFWCRVCAMLHDTTHPAKTYGNIEEWWRGKDVCIGKDRWAQHPRTNPFISNYYGTSNR